MKLQLAPRPLEAIDAELKKAWDEIRDGEQRENQIENIAEILAGSKADWPRRSLT